MGQHASTALIGTVGPYKEVSNSSPLGTVNINSVSGQTINRGISSAFMSAISASYVYT